MGHRIFKSINHDFCSNEDYMIILADSKITSGYNAFGMYYDNGQSYDESCFEEKDGLYEIDSIDDLERDIQAWIITEYGLDEDNIICTKECMDKIIELSAFRQERDDCFYEYEVTRFVFENGEMSEETAPEHDELYCYWDGHNNKALVLTTDDRYSSYKEVTDRFEDFEDWKEFNREVGSTCSSSWYLAKNSEDEPCLIKCSSSRFEGSITEFTEEEIEDNLLMILGNEDARSFFSEFIEEFINGFDLKKGSQITIDEETICLSFRDQQYHFSQDEIDNLNKKHLLEKAYDKINERRRATIEERLETRLDETLIERIFVEISDSIDAGNCEVGTDRFVRSNFENSQQAIRADELLKIRDDGYTRRAIRKAWKKGHYIKKQTSTDLTAFWAKQARKRTQKKN